MPNDRTLKMSLRPTKFGGHCYYVRRCLVGDKDGKWDERSIGGIAIPVTVAETCLSVEVLTFGPNVGKPCGDLHAKTFYRPRQLVPSVSVGDLLLCPKISMGYRTSGLVDEVGRKITYEAYIEESIPIGIWKEGNTLAPIGDKVLVMPEDEQEITEKSVVLPSERAKMSWRGIVIAVGAGWVSGDGKVNVPDVNVGDKVLVQRIEPRSRTRPIGVQTISIPGEPMMVCCRELDILAVI